MPLSWFRRRPIVLVVCTANVCRSPMAAALLRAKLASRGGARRYRVVSAGTRVGAPGRKPDPRIGKQVTARGGSLRGERARQLTASLARRAELIVVMELRHREEIEEMLGESPDRESPPMRRLGDWYGSDTGADGDIADPYFSNAAAMKVVAEQLDEACSALADQLLSKSVDSTTG